MQALFEARLKATDEEIKQIDFLVDFIYWISHSNFRRHQQPEPEVGDPSSTVPAAVEGQGIKGQSVYTSLFHHLDMERFTCKLCHHIVEENLEDAITHQRIAHFGHYPYQCLPNHTPWYVPFSLPVGQNQECIFDSAGSGSRVKRVWRRIRTLMDTNRRLQQCSMSYSYQIRFLRVIDCPRLTLCIMHPSLYGLELGSVVCLLV